MENSIRKIAIIICSMSQIFLELICERGINVFVSLEIYSFPKCNKLINKKVIQKNRLLTLLFPKYGPFAIEKGETAEKN